MTSIIARTVSVGMIVLGIAGCFGAIFWHATVAESEARLWVMGEHLLKSPAPRTTPRAAMPTFDTDREVSDLMRARLLRNAGLSVAVGVVGVIGLMLSLRRSKRHSISPLPS